MSVIPASIDSLLRDNYRRLGIESDEDIKSRRMISPSQLGSTLNQMALGNSRYDFLFYQGSGTLELQSTLFQEKMSFMYLRIAPDTRGMRLTIFRDHSTYQGIDVEVYDYRIKGYKWKVAMKKDPHRHVLNDHEVALSFAWPERESELVQIVLNPRMDRSKIDAGKNAPPLGRQKKQGKFRYQFPSMEGYSLR